VTEIRCFMINIDRVRIQMSMLRSAIPWTVHHAIVCFEVFNYTNLIHLFHPDFGEKKRVLVFMSFIIMTTSEPCHLRHISFSNPLVIHRYIF